jgi:predicted transcriptional regulator
MDDSALSRRERQIMNVLYERGSSTVAEVQEAMADAPSYSAVRTLIGILETKGHVTHARDGKRYVYSAAMKPAHAARSALNHVLQTFFAGSVEKAVATLLTGSEARLTHTEYERLAAIVAEAARETKEHD